MTAALLWKEYRQQRAVWLAIAFLGGIADCDPGRHSGGREIGWQAFR